MPATRRKQTGAHFTPPELASVLAERLVDYMRCWGGSIRILDPACGDGNLLVAIASALPRNLLFRSTLIGIENDPCSFSVLQTRLRPIGDCRIELLHGDFLEFFDDGGLFVPQQKLDPVDVIIANPPYVRTQVLGAKRARTLALRFGLSGRVDLYQAFLVAMAEHLRVGGLLGVITSNRFLTTRAGAATRRFLRSHFVPLEVIDLGDTKLFDAAVLPALFFGVKRESPPSPGEPVAADFVRIYEEVDPSAKCIRKANSVVDLVRQPRTGFFAVNKVVYRVATGKLAVPKDEGQPWRMVTKAERAWLDQIHAAAACTIGAVARIRVGIKTTADKVFIRSDWHSLPSDCRPEERHLKPLLSHEDAAKWKPSPPKRSCKRVLYTHEVVDGRRRPICFNEQSPTWKYLLSHRSELVSRSYVVEAGRRWYEIWVPQDPGAWSLPKIVFPDISPEPRFFLDRCGCIVNGNCYWITTNDPDDEDLLLLILGVCNSSVMTQYHELAFQNKLYSQRRRYLTQYVQEYPLPDRNTQESKRLIAIVRALVVKDMPEKQQKSLEAEIDKLLAKAFGVPLSPATDTLD